MTEDLDSAVLLRLRELVGDSNVTRLVELFQQNVRDRQGEIERAFRESDQRALTNAFHSIKGSAQLVGAKRLEEVSAGWEELARAGEIESVDAALEEIVDSFHRVLAALATSDPGGSD